MNDFFLHFDHFSCSSVLCFVWGDEIFAYCAPSSGEIWNFLRAFDLIGRLCRWFLLEVVLFYCWLFQWVLSHQVEMICFYRILLHFDSAWSGRRRYRVKHLCRLKLVWNFNTFDRFPLVGCGLLLRCKRVVSIIADVFCLFFFGRLVLGCWNICILRAI